MSAAKKGKLNEFERYAKAWDKKNKPAIPIDPVVSVEHGLMRLRDMCVQTLDDLDKYKEFHAAKAELTDWQFQHAVNDVRLIYALVKATQAKSKKAS